MTSKIKGKLVGGIAGLLGAILFLTLTSAPANAGVVTTNNVKKTVATAVGVFVGATVGAAVTTATSPSGPVSVGAGAVAGLGAGAAATALTLQALNHPVQAVQTVSIVTNPLNALLHPSLVMSEAKGLIKWLF